MHCTGCFQNIIYALIIRTKDGMPLSASTDFTDEINKNIKECKRYVKLLSKKRNCFQNDVFFNYSRILFSSFMSYLGVTYLSLCLSSYPTVLAFSFLNELMKEFIISYSKTKIENVVRPYSFLEFDNYIHKTCQRYNKPQSLTTRINLSELSLEMKLRPPYVIKLDEIEPSKNGFTPDIKLPYTVSHKLKFEDLSFISFCVMSFSMLLSLVSLLRGISTLCESSFEEFALETHLNGVSFLLDAILRFSQIYLLVHQIKYRKLKSWIILILLCLVQWYVSRVRDNWQTAMCLFSLMSLHSCIIFRKIQSKLPDYQV